jgi:hypothetical protein
MSMEMGGSAPERKKGRDVHLAACGSKAANQQGKICKSLVTAKKGANQGKVA